MHSRLISDIKEILKLKNAFSQELLAILLSDNLVQNFVDSDFLINPFDKLFIESFNVENVIQNNIDTQEKRSSLPLGKYAELLFGNALEANINYEVLTRNLQIFKDKTTVGEIDFFLRCIHDNTYYHLEFAHKYYLKTPFKNSFRYLGPSTKDWLKNKITKMVNQQLMITEDYKSQLPLPFSNYQFRKKIIIKGSIFIPFEDYSFKSASLSIGWWANFDNAACFFKNDFLFLPIFFRKDWIFPFNVEGTLFQMSDLIIELNNNELINHGIMVVRYDTEKNPIDRGFLMKTNWPNY